MLTRRRNYRPGGTTTKSITPSKRSLIMASVKKKRGGNYCCVVGCNKNEGAHRPDTSFFKFPKSRNLEQHDLWLKAISRINPDGSPWVPHPKRGLVCSDHFVSGKPSSTNLNPDYVPSIFPTRHVKAKTKADSARTKRLLKRRSAVQTTTPATTFTEIASTSGGGRSSKHKSF